MPQKKPYKVDIDVVPYLSIMAIVLKLISLILIVMVMRIAMNPDAMKVIRYDMLYKPPEEIHKKTPAAGNSVEKEAPYRVPIYFDCSLDGIDVIRFDKPTTNTIALVQSQVRLNDALKPSSDVQQALQRLVKNYRTEYAILIIRPRAAAVYRFMRKEIASRKLDVGYDVLEADQIIDWKDQVKRLQVKLEDLEKSEEEKSKKKPGEKKRKET
jgi:hypothetical protein